MRLSADDIMREHEPAPTPPRSSVWGVELVVAIVGVVLGLSAVLFLLS